MTGRRSDPDQYCFRTQHRSEDAVGNVKQVWEIGRLQHLTLAATAWYLSREPAYAELAAAQLRSFWRENPFLSGVHWTSGIEVGIRLISFAWIRRLLDDWPGVADLFEGSSLAVAQIRWHQRYLAGFRSRGSSANNHVIAEAAGQLAGSCAFAWFEESDRWRRQSARLLEAELLHNTFASGVGRELASDYQGFIAELGLLAAVEAAAAGHPLGDAAWQRLAALTDSAAAQMDERLRPPRQGDGDEGRALLLDAPAVNRWPSLLAVGAALFGPLDWWPAVPADAASTLTGALAGGPRQAASRPGQRPSRFADAGLTILRTPGTTATAGPRAPRAPRRSGAGATAARTGSSASPLTLTPTRCRWNCATAGSTSWPTPARTAITASEPGGTYFRSTLGHNTAELAGRDQSASGGPFLWLRHAASRETEARTTGDGVLCWAAEHDGYQSLNPPGRHRRQVRLDQAAAAVEIADEVDGAGHGIRLAFHLGPEVQAELAEPGTAVLRWPDAATPGSARLALPGGLTWRLHRGETDPILGWYSAGFGLRAPSYTLIGSGTLPGPATFVTRLEFSEPAESPESPIIRADVSLSAASAPAGDTSESRAEAG